VVSKGKPKVRESHSGFHFVNLYQNCARKFHLKYNLRIEPAHTSHQLLLGSAIHRGKAAWYRSKRATLATVLRETGAELTARRKEFQNDDLYAQTKDRALKMVGAWVDRWGQHDRERYDVVAVEKEIVMPIGGTNGFSVTLRPDAILKDKDHGYVFIMETKSTGFSMIQAEKGVYYGDQATMYLMGATRVLGLDVDGVIPDILYWHKSSKDPSSITCVRGDVVTRTPEDFERLERNLASLLNEISQKVAAWNRGIDEDDLFPMNTARCMDFFGPCEFADICRSRIDRSTRLGEDLRFGDRRTYIALTDSTLE